MTLMRLERIVLVLLLGTGLPLLFLPVSWFPVFYDVRYMALQSFFSIAVILVAARVFKIPKVAKFPEVFLRSILVVVLVFDAAGNIGLYQLFRYGFQYDKFAHFVSPFVLAIGFVVYLIKRKMYKIKKALALTTAVILGLAIVWELFEMFADVRFNTRLFGVYGLDVKRDTIIDVVYNIFGLLSAWLVVYANKSKLGNEQS